MPVGDTLQPCEAWCTWDDLPCLSDEDQAALDAAVDADRRARIIAKVSEVLFLLDHQAMPGLCVQTRTFCRPCGCAATSCCCRDRATFDLSLAGRYPVDSVSEVLVAGAVLPAASYRVDDWRWLVRLDGDSWPRCVDVVDEPTGFAVTWTYGVPISDGGREAAATMVYELARKCAGLDCQVPEHVTTVSREGTTYVVLDSFKMLSEGRTGFFWPDLWLMARNQARTAGTTTVGGIDPTGDCRVAIATDTGAAGVS